MKLERLDYVHANVHVEQDEWDCIKSMAQHAVENYDQTNLDYLIDAPADVRYSRLVGLNEFVHRENQSPMYMSEQDLGMLKLVFDQLDDKDVPNVNKDVQERLTQELMSYNFRKFFETPADEAKKNDNNQGGGQDIEFTAS